MALHYLSTGIDFSDLQTPYADMDSELMDHYEEGSWVLALTGSSGNGSGSGGPDGNYTRIGNVVNTQVNIQLGSYTFGSAAGDMRCSHPFTAQPSGWQTSMGGAVGTHLVDFAAATLWCTVFLNGAAAWFGIQQFAKNASWNGLDWTHLTTADQIRCSFHFQVAT